MYCAIDNATGEPLVVNVILSDTYKPNHKGLLVGKTRDAVLKAIDVCFGDKDWISGRFLITTVVSIGWMGDVVEAEDVVPASAFPRA